jgi:hypothetical protein
LIAIHNLDCVPQRGIVYRERATELFLFQFGDLVRESRHFSACRITMHDAFLRRADQSRLNFGHGAERAAVVTRDNRLFDLTDRRALVGGSD